MLLAAARRVRGVVLPGASSGHDDTDALGTLLVEACPDPIFVKAPDGSYRMANAAFCRFVGLPLAILLGMRDTDLEDAEVARHAIAVRRHVVATGETVRLDLWLRHQGTGERRILQTVVSPLRRADGGVAAVAYFSRDVTDQTRFERQMREAQARAEAASQAKSRLLAVASHDLRQPMQAALLMSDRLGRRARGGPAEAAAGQLDALLRTMSDLLQNLFDFSRADAGETPVLWEDVSLAELVGQIAAVHRAQAEAKGVGLVAQACDHLVRTDRVLLGRVLRNLVENAIRYTERGEVRIACVALPRSVSLTVADTGAGIARDEQGRIWNEFQRGAEASRESEGLGLGLSIVRRLTAALGIRVALASEPGQGSAFSLFLPLAGQAAMPRTVAPEPAIVLVTADPLARLRLESLLTGWGAEVICGERAQQAIDHAAALGIVPAAVIADGRAAPEDGLCQIALVRQALAPHALGLLLADPDRAGPDMPGNGPRVIRAGLDTDQVAAALGHLFSQ